MAGNFNVQFFDLIVYVFPGATLLLGALLIWRPKFLRDINGSRHVIHYILCGFVAAFVVGFGLHTLMTVMQGGIDRVIGARSLDRTLEKFPEMRIVEQIAEVKLKFDLNDRMALFRYAETVVDENLPVRAATASRLEALALFSRNLIPAVCLLGLAVAWTYSESGRLVALILVGTALTVIVLRHGYVVYTSNSVGVVVRAFLAWLTGGA